MWRVLNPLTLLVVAILLSPALTACGSEAERDLRKFTNERNQAAQAFSEGYFSEAETRYQRALKYAEDTWGKDHVNVARALTDLGWFHHQRREYEKAATFLDRAVAVRRKAVGRDDVAVADALILVAANHEAAEKFDEAEEEYKRSLAIREKSAGPNHLDVARSLDRLAGCYWKQGKYAEAEPLLERAVAISDGEKQAGGAGESGRLRNLAAVYYRLGKLERAEQMYERALAAQERELGAQSPALSVTLDSYALVLRQTGKEDEARKLEARAGRLRDRAMTKEMKESFDRFARKVTMHLLDDSYGTFERSQDALTRGELSPEVVAALREARMLPESPEKVQAKAKELARARQVTDVRIEKVRVDPPTSLGLIPLEVQGLVTVRAGGAATPAKVEPFRFKYVLGMDTKTRKPVVAQFEKSIDGSGHPRAETAPTLPPASAGAQAEKPGSPHLR